MTTKLIKLLTIPLIAFGINSCMEQTEPVKEDYNSWYAPIEGIEPNCYVKDFDHDGKVDAITNSRNYALFYVKGYENKINVEKWSEVMNPKMREAATNLLKNYNELNYQIAKADYESDRNKESKK